MRCASCGASDEFIVDDHCDSCGINVYEQPGGNPYLEHDASTRALALDLLDEQRRADERADYLHALEHLDSENGDYYAAAGTPTDWAIAENALNI